MSALRFCNNQGEQGNYRRAFCCNAGYYVANSACCSSLRSCRRKRPQRRLDSHAEPAAAQAQHAGMRAYLNTAVRGRSLCLAGAQAWLPLCAHAATAALACAAAASQGSW